MQRSVVITHLRSRAGGGGRSGWYRSRRARSQGAIWAIDTDDPNRILRTPGAPRLEAWEELLRGDIRSALRNWKEENKACLKGVHVTRDRTARSGGTCGGRWVGERERRERRKMDGKRQSSIMHARKKELRDTAEACVRAPASCRCVWQNVLDEAGRSADGVNCGGYWRETVETGSRLGDGWWDHIVPVRCVAVINLAREERGGCTVEETAKRPH